jgi:hypothetical protein
LISQSTPSTVRKPTLRQRMIGVSFSIKPAVVLAGGPPEAEQLKPSVSF